MMPTPHSPVASTTAVPRIDVRALLGRAQRLIAAGRRLEACTLIASAEAHATNDALLWDTIGTLFSRASNQHRALAAYERAVALAPRRPEFLFNRAAVRRFLGALEDAESDYDQVIALKPNDFEAYRNRSELRRQTADRNHVTELTSVLTRPDLDWRGRVQLLYALGKEHEDLRDYRQAFACFHAGAGLRRAHLSYDVAHDEATVDWIIEAFSNPVAAPGEPGRSTDGTSSAPAPRLSVRGSEGLGHGVVFIVGLPRSGSTLVERILAGHPDLTPAGELPCFAEAVVLSVRRPRESVPPTRREIVARTAQLDFPALGRAYLQRVHAALEAGPRFIDKMPLNYLYCGLIARALPGARIVHVSRSPMASCFAMYKALFEDGYPFSYDLTELGRYFAGYQRLMRHWRAALPGRIHELRYEALVEQPKAETRRLLAFCDLDWFDGCLEFHRVRAPSTTASAAQVRQPLYHSAVAQWRHYRTELEPLRESLVQAGAEVPA
jgi:tetratricopeptide (TPR) repeat protein